MTKSHYAVLDCLRDLLRARAHHFLSLHVGAIKEFYPPRFVRHFLAYPARFFVQNRLSEVIHFRVEFLENIDRTPEPLI